MKISIGFNSIASALYGHFKKLWVSLRWSRCQQFFTPYTPWAGASLHDPLDPFLQPSLLFFSFIFYVSPPPLPIAFFFYFYVSPHSHSTIPPQLSLSSSYSPVGPNLSPPAFFISTVFSLPPWLRSFTPPPRPINQCEIFMLAGGGGSLTQSSELPSMVYNAFGNIFLSRNY